MDCIISVGLVLGVVDCRVYSRTRASAKVDCDAPIGLVLGQDRTVGYQYDVLGQYWTSYKKDWYRDSSGHHIRRTGTGTEMDYVQSAGLVLGQ